MNKKNFLAVLLLAGITALIFFKIFTKGLYPIPGDLLVSFYYPWYSGGWEGYNPWTTHKELLGADSIRQIYLWKEFAMEQFKLGQIPLWNPYAFSGQPLLANFQSSVFYPINIFYFLTDARNAWLLLVISQPFLGGLFMYLLLKSYKLTQTPSLFGATAFMFSSYLITWMENGNIAHSYIWLPLAFWAVNKYFEKFKFRFLLVLISSLSLSILGGHPQTAIYLYMAVFIYWIFKVWGQKNLIFQNVSTVILTFIASLALTGIQLVPTYEFYKLSPISLPFSSKVFDRSIFPYQNLVTFFAPDFFGHPASENFWSQTYGDFTPYFGVVPLVFTLWGVFRLWKNKFIKFAAIVSAFFIASAVSGPITWAIKTFQLPLLNSTTPSRFISISIFLLIIISAFGLKDFLKNFKEEKYKITFLKFAAVLSLVYIALWSFAVFGIKFLEPQNVWSENLIVTRRNLIIPTSLFISVPVGIIGLVVLKRLLNLKLQQLKVLAIIGIFSTTIFGGMFFSNKFLPVSPKIFIFPNHPVFDWLNENANLYRFYGGGTAHIDFNFPTHYAVFGAEGYDTLRYERYAQLLASGFDGKVPETYLRSDAVFANEENGYRKRLFELLGVRYLLDKEDNPKTGQDWHYERFPNDKLKGIWQEDKFQIYEREPVLPRIFLTNSYLVEKEDDEIIKKIYDPDFNLETVVVEKEPKLSIEDSRKFTQIPEVEKYSPNEIVVNTNSESNNLLFISDAFDPDWSAYVNGKKTEVLRAHYALRAVEVPSGVQTIKLRYEPKSFTVGLALSSISVLTLALLSTYNIKRKKF